MKNNNDEFIEFEIAAVRIVIAKGEKGKATGISEKTQLPVPSVTDTNRIIAVVFFDQLDDDSYCPSAITWHLTSEDITFHEEYVNFHDWGSPGRMDLPAATGRFLSSLSTYDYDELRDRIEREASRS